MFGFGKKKKEEPVEAPEETVPEDEIGDRLFPGELEKFKLKGPFEEALEKSDSPPPRFAGRARPAENKDDNEMVVARLDAIEARLKVVEEKLKRL